MWKLGWSFVFVSRRHSAMGNIFVSALKAGTIWNPCPTKIYTCSLNAAKMANVISHGQQVVSAFRDTG